MEETQNSLPPTVLVIFGSTGNLAQKKLIPALYHLLKGRFLPKEFSVVCIARDKNATVDSILDKAKYSFTQNIDDIDEAVFATLKSLMQVITMDSTNQDDFHRLKDVLDGIDSATQKSHNRLFYLAIPPNIFNTVISCLGSVGLNDEFGGASRRILVEKPFGTNLSSAKELVSHIAENFGEHQVYRIDHYLAKETAQNLLAFRFNNPIIEDLWSRQFVDHIQITAAETIDIEGRSDFYEGMGALRDFVQSHLLQLMALTMMEVPHPLNAENIHAEKLTTLEAIRPIKFNHVDEAAVRGQYIGYREETGNADSNIETYAAIHLEVANSRWGGVPVLIRTGKALADKTTEITIVFRDRTRRNVAPNLLTIRIQPNEGIGISMQAKKPGFSDELQPVNMDFCYQTSFDGVQPDAYERVLIDAISGDQSLFATSAEVLRCWEILEPIIDVWQQDDSQLHFYEKGSWGPDAATELASSYGCEWLSNASHVCAVHPSIN